MPKRFPEISGSSIVLLGSFNPAIFQPEWFARQGLLAQEQVAAAEVKVIVPQITQFETEQFTLQVTQNRFLVISKAGADPAPLGDFVQGTFFILEHTPVSAMGLNRLMHFSLKTEESWHELGDKLAPKDGWRGILEGRPGMQSLTISTEYPKLPGGRYLIKVEPSTQVKFGVYFETNEHYPAPEEDSLKVLMALLRERWEECPVYAAAIVDHILDWSSTRE